MHPEVDELRPKIKEILYDCAVEIRATKAALYLREPSGKYELVTEYGFRGAIRQITDANDPLVDRCGRGRTPFFVNGVATEPRFSELLYETSTDRLLAAPLYSRGQLVGLIDMRDKAAKQPFEQPDVGKAQKIAERIVALFINKNVFGQRFITLSDHEDDAAPPPDEPVRQVVSPNPPLPRASQPAAAPAPPPSAPPLAAPTLAAPKPAVAPKPAPAARPAAPTAPAAPQVSRVGDIVVHARNVAGRIILPPAAESISESELAVARDALRGILAIPGAAVAMLSAFGHLGGVQEIAARGTLTDDGRNFLQSKLNVWLTKRGDTPGFVRTNVQPLPGGSIGPAELQKVFTAPLNIGSLRGMYLTIAFSTAPDRAAHELLASLHAHLQLSIEQSLSRNAQTATRAVVAEKLLEPDFSKYPELRRHSELVAKLCEGFAKFLALTPAEIETARLAGLVHDAGMRLLDYERLYRKRDLTPDELGILREHVSVSAALIEPLLGHELARIVLCHHERVDGHGYPNQLHGDEIPYLSRLLQICDAWVAMTDPDSYLPPDTADEAMDTLTRAGGSQFDAELSRRFVEFLRAR
ncbi:MAG TPA: HD domain-containing phosphohydrolase [Thermoanaerobaculia bacterium]|nr:HD domain-containing phosphohydrolase [Thermoanaerobaculia bacterium]